MATCTFNARTLASEACIEDPMIQARKIKYDVIGLTKTRRHRPLHAVCETGEELFLGTCDSRGVGGVGVLVNTHLAMNIDSYESLTTRIGRLRLRRCGSTTALTVSEDHTLFKVIVGDFNAKIGPRRTTEELHIGTHGMEWNEQGERLSEFIMSTHTIHVRGERAAKSRKRSPKTVVNWDHFASLASLWEDSVNDNIDEEYDQLVEHLHDCARRAESLKDVKKRLSSKTLELVRQRGIARATGNHQQTSELAKVRREAIEEDLKERRAAVMDEAAEAGKSIRKARRNFANYKTKMTSLHRPDGTVTASRRAMENVIYDFYSDLFDSYVYRPTCHLRQDGYVVLSVLPSEI
uniref:Reverse transcriptase domain-containing protein n=1 Tax=Haemonchus contortus TaxID=6289 RepID=A0A7I4Z8G8_HAECO